MRRRSLGFTLLEVLIATFFLALGLLAAVRVGTQKASESGELRDAMLANWVAANVIEETRLTTPWPDPGLRRGEAEMGHRTWYWELTINDTEEPDLRRLDVVVYRDEKREFGAVSLTGFSGRTGRGP